MNPIHTMANIDVNCTVVCDQVSEKGINLRIGLRCLPILVASIVKA